MCSISYAIVPQYVSRRCGSASASVSPPTFRRRSGRGDARLQLRRELRDEALRLERGIAGRLGAERVEVAPRGGRASGTPSRAPSRRRRRRASSSSDSAGSVGGGAAPAAAAAWPLPPLRSRSFARPGLRREQLGRRALEERRATPPGPRPGSRGTARGAGPRSPCSAHRLASHCSPVVAAGAGATRARRPVTTAIVMREEEAERPRSARRRAAAACRGRPCRRR